MTNKNPVEEAPQLDDLGNVVPEGYEYYEKMVTPRDGLDVRGHDTSYAAIEKSCDGGDRNVRDARDRRLIGLKQAWDDDLECRRSSRY